MDRTEQTLADQGFDETILDQDFDEWQADDGYDALDLDDDDYSDFSGDSHFMLSELDFAGEFDSL